MMGLKIYHSVFVLFSFAFLQTLASGSLSTGAVKCGPPTLLNDWNNETAVVGSRAILTCPLDSLNSCLVNLVEWYRRDGDPRGNQTPRRLLRDEDGIRVFAFDPLMIVLENVKPEDRGWFTCVVGNSDGRAEHSTYLDVVTEMNRPETRKPLIAMTTSSPVIVRETTISSTITSSLQRATKSKVLTGSTNEVDNVKIPTNKEEEVPFRRNPDPELYAALPQVLPNSKKVSYSASRYSYSAPSGSAGYAPWYDKSYYDSSRSYSVEGSPTPSTTTPPPPPPATTVTAPPPPTTTTTITAQPRILQWKQNQKSTPEVSHFGGDENRNQLHLDAINEHLHYIYARLEDLVKRVEKLEKYHPDIVI